MKSDPKDELPSLLTVAQAAKTLNVGRTKIYELMKKGEIPYFTLDEGGHRRIRADAIREYIARREVHAPGRP